MTQTAGLAMSYFDRFLSKTQGRLVKQRVQLTALTCTLLAAKFSEIKMPALDDLCEVAHGKYSKAQLKECELEIIRVLQWELHAVTPHAALEQFAIVINLTDEQTKSYLEHAEFFIDMSYYVVRPHPDIPTPSRAPRPAPPPTHTHIHAPPPWPTAPHPAPQYDLLKFPPLVVAASALLCAWSHLGNLAAIEHHMPQLCALCGVGKVTPPPPPSSARPLRSLTGSVCVRRTSSCGARCFCTITSCGSPRRRRRRLRCTARPA